MVRLTRWVRVSSRRKSSAYDLRKYPLARGALTGPASTRALARPAQRRRGAAVVTVLSRVHLAKHSYPVQLLARAEQTPRTDEQHQGEDEKRSGVGQLGVDVVDEQDFGRRDDGRAGQGSRQTVEPADQCAGKRLQTDDDERLIEGGVACDEHAGEARRQGGERPRQRVNSVQIDAALRGEQRVVAGRAHADAPGGVAQKGVQAG